MNKIFLLTITSVLFCWSCGTNPPAPAELAQELSLNDSLLQVVTVDTVHNTPFKDELLLNGRVAFDPEKVAYVYPVFGGKVTECKVEMGDHVRKGDILAVIHSSEVAEFEKEKNEAAQQIIIAKRNLEIAQDMFKSGMASEVDILLAEQEMITAEAEQNRLKELYEINHITTNSSYAIVSPVTGFITEKNINRNMILRDDQDEALFVVSGLDEIWVTADVYESDITKVKEGAEVRITTLAYRDKEFSGVIDRVFNTLDEESKTMTVRVKLQNKDYLLKPGLFTNVYVQRITNEKVYPCIPAKAVIFEDGKEYVVKVADNNRLTIQPVHTYKQTENYAYITTGLTDGDRIIHRNALLVYNALK